MRDGRDRPFRLADVCGFGEEVGHLAGVDLLLADAAAGQKLLAAWFELARQFRQESAGFGGKNLGSQLRLRRAVVVVMSIIVWLLQAGALR